MDSREIYKIITEKLGREWYNRQENELLDSLLKKKEKDEKVKDKEFENILTFLDKCKNQLSMEDEIGNELEKTFDETANALKSLKTEKKKKEKVEIKIINKEFQVASSEIFPSKKNSTSWSPKCLLQCQ